MVEYYQVLNDVKLAVDHFKESIVEQLMENGKAFTDMSEYPEGASYHHSKHVDRGYTLREAVEVLEVCSEHEVDDDGYWEGQPPHQAIPTMAAYTYGNAVFVEFGRLIEEINDDCLVDEILGQYAEYVRYKAKNDPTIPCQFPDENDVKQALLRVIDQKTEIQQ